MSLFSRRDPLFAESANVTRSAVCVQCRQRRGSPWKRLEGHTGPVSSVSYSNSGRRCVAASDDGTVRLWASSDGAALLSIPTNCAPRGGKGVLSGKQRSGSTTRGRALESKVVASRRASSVARRSSANQVSSVRLCGMPGLAASIKVEVEM